MRNKTYLATIIIPTAIIIHRHRHPPPSLATYGNPMWQRGISPTSTILQRFFWRFFRHHLPHWIFKVASIKSLKTSTLGGYLPLCHQNPLLFLIHTSKSGRYKAFFFLVFFAGGNCVGMCKLYFSGIIRGFFCVCFFFGCFWWQRGK